VLAAPQSESQNAKTLKANDEVYREYMVNISRQLGVTCNACHNQNNFADAEKKEFKISKDHIRLTQMLIDNGMNGEKGKPKADCFMCHRGKIMPDYKEPHDPMTMEKASAGKKKKDTAPAAEKE
jgi:cytochrome c peroxidase